MYKRQGEDTDVDFKSEEGDDPCRNRHVYSALTAIYIIIMGVVQGDENGDSGLPIMLVIATYFGARFLPLSMGSVILYSVLNLSLIHI